VNKGSFQEPGLAYDAGFNDYLGFLCDAAPEALTDPAATCDALRSDGVPTDASDLNLPSIGIAELPGSQTVTRTVTSVARERGRRTYTVSVDAPPGYDVSVSPASIRLKSGETATYQVTVTNDGSAPVDEWRTGSLTWNDKNGHYSVYSPIAVRGIALLVPGSIQGNGTSGSASFQVTFGYTGPYTAAAHGLAEDVVVPGNVPQDPDQNFFPFDGFSEAHVLDLTNAVHARFALPPGSTEAGADLDLYVFDPSGRFVASSTNPGTDELVDVENPVAGNWTVYVHGWSTPGGDSDYDMDSWIVPQTNTTLVIESAPASATIGATDTVDVSWDGLSSGPAYLGAVSHSDASGQIGFTLIEIDPD
jgi:hypothetical protein